MQPFLQFPLRLLLTHNKIIFFLKITEAFLPWSEASVLFFCVLFYNLITTHSGLTSSSHTLLYFHPRFALPIPLNDSSTSNYPFILYNHLLFLYTFLPSCFVGALQTFQISTISTCGVVQLAAISNFCLLVDYCIKLPVTAIDCQ